MKIETLVCAILAIGLCLRGVLAVDNISKFETHARISKAKAEKIALAKVPGDKIKEVEIEEKHGRLKLSFDIAVAGTKPSTEVEVVPGPATSSARRLTTRKASTKTTKTRKMMTMMTNRVLVHLEHGLSPGCRHASTG